MDFICLGILDNFLFVWWAQEKVQQLLKQDKDVRLEREKGRKNNVKLGHLVLWTITVVWFALEK